MNTDASRERLETLIASSGVPLASLTPREGLELMLRVYGDDPADGHLSCSWGVVTRYGPVELGFNLTRWFLPSDDLSEPGLLSLVFKFGPQPAAGDFPGWMKWCAGPEELTDFRSSIEETPAFKAWAGSPAPDVALVFEDFASMAHGLFDCWGSRDPSRPIVTMTEEEWLRSDDVSLMLRWFRQEWRGKEAELDSIIQRYCLACCRRIWPLLPREESRAGVEVAERFIDGRATRDELGGAEWLAEAAAFTFEQNSEPDSIARWCDEVARLSPEELGAMIHSPRPEDDLSPRGLLSRAAYFTDAAMCYYGLVPKESIERYRLFLSASLLREMVGNPFRPSSDLARE